MAVNRNLQIFIAIIALSSIAGISFMLGVGHGRKDVRILYISQVEILGFEKMRIKDEALENRQLFFGKPDAAVKYIEQEQDKMTKGDNLVLLTDSKIYGSNVHSVSREVHAKVVNSLKASKANE